MKCSIYGFLFVVFLCPPVIGQGDSLSGLQTDNMLHPADGFTAQTLKKNEFVYYQPLLFIENPSPIWFSWGITNKLTAEVDLSAIIHGVSEEQPRFLPVINLRYKFRDQQQWVPAIAAETMFEHLGWGWNSYGGNFAPTPLTSHNRIGWSARVNMGWALRKKFNIHTSLGASYTEELFMADDSGNVTSFYRTVNPDFSATADWRPLPWLSTHLSLSYGVTSLFVDHIPRKYQVAYSFRFAPFHKRKWGILRTFRVELGAFYCYFPDTQRDFQVMVPLITSVYWQWTCKKRNHAN
ncbi:MAG: hypothetical protein HYZ14_16960 [Bacteroidetes bacterium]|nr:hypothetical protein [Bacteroidota bacterium]